MNSKYIPEHDYAINPQNVGPWLMKSSQSNFILRSPSSYLAGSYLIATVTFVDRLVLSLYIRRGQVINQEPVKSKACQT